MSFWREAVRQELRLGRDPVDLRLLQVGFERGPVFEMFRAMVNCFDLLVGSFKVVTIPSMTL